jgi:hypothetical protein
MSRLQYEGHPSIHLQVRRMSVNFILEENDADWRMKIGRAKNRVARRRALQTDNSRSVKLGLNRD